jgi:hypothetical protein
VRGTRRYAGGPHHPAVAAGAHSMLTRQVTRFSSKSKRTHSPSHGSGRSGARWGYCGRAPAHQHAHVGRKSPNSTLAGMDRMRGA